MFGLKDPTKCIMFGLKDPNIMPLFEPELLYTLGTLLVPMREKFHKNDKKNEKNNIKTDISTAALIERHHFIVIFFLYCTREI